MRPSSRHVAVVVAALVVLSPLARNPRDDSYPLSTYPMFASDRGPVHRLATAVEVHGDGSTSRLSPETLAGTDEGVLASVTVTRAVRDGDAATLCDEIAARLGPGRTVEVRVEEVDTIAFVARDAPARSIDVAARCGDD